MEVTKWIEEETSTLEFGDRRLKERCMKVLERLSTSPDKSIPASNKGWSETQAAYRFINNPKVSPNRILSAHKASTLSRIQQEAVVLIPQDTTEIDLTHRKGMDDLGYLSSKKGHGFYIHPSIAFTPERCCLGTIDFQLWLRKEIGSSEKRKKKPIEEKETYNWVKGYEAANEIAKLAPNTVVVSIADREGDIYEVLEKQRNEENKAYWLVRSQHDRIILNEETQQFEQKLRQFIQAAEIAGTMEFEVPAAWVNRNSKARYLRTKRLVKQEVRFNQITISPPRRPTKKLAPISIYVVHCKEINPPENEKPLEWYLLSNYPVDSIEKAVTMIDWYLCRWQIEVFFKVLKSGCKVEELQFDSLRNTSNCLALYMIVAWRVLFLMMMGRICPELSCELVFEQTEWQAVYAVVKKKKPPEVPPSIDTMVMMIAQLGGFLARKSDGYPGPKAIWQGIQRMRDFTIAWDSFLAMADT